MEQANSFGAAFGRLVKRKRGTHVTLAELARRIYPNLGEDAEKRKGDLSKLENGKVPNPNAATVAKIAKALGITDEEIETLQRRALAPLSDQLQEIAVLSRDELELLASRFEAEKPHARSDAELKDFLTKKAEDYRRIRAEVDGLKGISARIDNVRAAAEQAITDLQFDEARSLLDQAREIQKDLLLEPLKANAALLERVADIDLLQGRVDEAFRQLRAAADSFAAIDQREPIRLKVQHYCTKLYNHGLRYGGAGLARAADLIRPCLSDDLRDADPYLWSSAQVWLANALANQGTRTGGEGGTALLAQAVAAYRQALTVRTPADHPVQWAGTMQNLAGALHTQSTRAGGDAGTALLAQAVATLHKALTVLTPADHPVDWARTMQNLAIALQTQGAGTGGEAGTDLLGQAVAAYRQALTVRTPADHPVQWAITQENLGVCEQVWAQHPACADPLPHLRAALAHVDAALTVYDPVHLPYYHDKASALRDAILAALGP